MMPTGDSKSKSKKLACYRHIVREREKHNRKDEPSDRDAVHDHADDRTHVEGSAMHGLAAEDDICQDRDEICDVVDRSAGVSVLIMVFIWE